MVRATPLQRKVAAASGFNMQKKYFITEEEFTAIQTAIENVLGLWQYDIIIAEDENESQRSMSKQTFFESLKREFEIK